jgi:hypothetical protein
MNTNSRQETARERVATIIQAARRGECTPHEAAGRVLALLGYPTPAPRSGPIDPLPCPATPSDKEDSPSLLFSPPLPSPFLRQGPPAPRIREERPEA